MPFPEKRIRRDYQPRDLRDAFRACKDYARQHKRLSVERLADLVDASPDALYKWLGDARMPAAKIQAFEHACGVHFVSEYLAGNANRLVVRVPAGHPASAEDIAGLMTITADAVAKLARFWRHEISYEEAHAGLTVSLQATAWHRENIGKAEAPELDLGGADD